MNDCRTKANKAVKELGEQMGGYVPPTLQHINKHYPSLAVIIKDMDKVINTDGALDRKTKRLIALACVAVRMCGGCVYPQAKVAKNNGATKEEIMEALNIAVLTGGVPTWSNAKDGISELFAEWEAEDKEKELLSGKKAPVKAAAKPKARKKTAAKK
ncbi:MAG: carboxymuconolactone decarboxylase family protein [Methanomassiliicoccales archaeon]|nr:carboxymuconolactone decarboxylase family protein [Methanomassiliicoccales archaeon]